MRKSRERGMRRERAKTAKTDAAGGANVCRSARDSGSGNARKRLRLTPGGRKHILRLQAITALLLTFTVERNAVRREPNELPRTRSAADACADPAALPKPGRYFHHPDLLPDGFGDRGVPEEIHEDRQGFFPCGARDDRMGGGTGLRFREPWVAGATGLGGKRISVRHHGGTLVLAG